MKSLFTISLALFLPLIVVAQDSIAVKKPARTQENMPMRRGRGTAKPMPSPRYHRSSPMPPKDTIMKGFSKRDTV